MSVSEDDRTGLTRNQGLVLEALSRADAPLSAYTILDQLRDAGQVEAAVAAALSAGKRKQPEAPSTTPAPKKPRATPREDASTTVMAVAPPENAS